MKKLTAILLSFIILISFAGCAKNANSANSSNIETVVSEIDILSSESVQNSSLNSSNSSSNNKSSKNQNSSSGTNNTNSSDKTNVNKLDDISVNNPTNVETGTLDVSNIDNIVIKPEDVKPTTPVTPPEKDQEKTENGNDVVTDGYVKVEDIPTTDEIPEQEKIDEIKEEIAVKTSHTPLASDEYYQYSSLTAVHKQVYNEIIKAIRATKNIINVSAFNIPREDGYLIIQKVLTDHPEYFYVSRFTGMTYNPITDIVTAMFIYYTDGETTDELGADNELIVTANRANIANQIKAFNKKTEEILKLIPLNTTQVAKEKFIHDYLVENITYDLEAAENLEIIYGQALTHDWDVYGALIEGSAVCEGYAKAFSFLCHCVGINATTIVGYCENMLHMWNAVQIDNDWYMLDTTWDDADIPLPIYQYFNITTEELNETHLIYTELKYPTCTATKNSYKNTYGINLENDVLPSNYKFVIDNTIKENSEYLQLYLGKDNTIRGQLIVELFINKTSPVQQYIKEKNYNITINFSYVRYGCYLCLLIEYK